MKLPVQDDRRIDEEAAAWLEVLSKGGPAERAAFAGWVKQSPRNVRAFLLMTALDIELDGVDAGRKHEARPDAAQVVPLGRHSRSPANTTGRGRRRRPLMRWAAALAAIAVAGVIATAVLSTRYATSVGEQRTFDLPDGSVVYLNTDSRIALDFSRSARDVRLLAGEALFKVTRDAARPFRVRTDDAVIQVIGTQFNVRRDSHGTKVSVIEGAVKVADQTTPLTAGQEATVQRKLHVVKRAAADVTRTLAWRQRRLMFRTDTLSDIATEFNRYNRSPRIRIQDESLGTLRFSGVFDADDPESFAQVLAGSEVLEVQRTDREIVIRRK